MPQPTLRQGAFNAPVTNMAIGYAQKPEQGAGWSRKLFPIVPVDSERGTYKVVNKGDWFRDEMVVRPDGTPAATAGYAMSEATYQLASYGLRFNVTDKQKKNKPQIWADNRAARFLQQKALIRADRLAVTNMLTAGVGWANEEVGAASAVSGTSVIGWSLANSTPVLDIVRAIDTVRQNTGQMPNRIAFSPDVGRVLRHHSEVLSYVQGGSVTASPGVVDYSALAKILGVAPDAIMELGTVYNSAAKGQTATMAYACTETCFIGYTTSAPDVEEPSAGYTFVHSEIDGLAEDGAVAIHTWRDEANRQDAYESDLYADIRLTASDCGFLFTSILT